jgi:hypothetical protein
MERSSNYAWYRNQDLAFWAGILGHLLKRSLRAHELARLAALIEWEPDVAKRVRHIIDMASRLPNGKSKTRPPRNLREAFEQSDRVWKIVRESQSPPAAPDCE